METVTTKSMRENSSQNMRVVNFKLLINHINQKLSSPTPNQLKHNIV